MSNKLSMESKTSGGADAFSAPSSTIAYNSSNFNIEISISSLSMIFSLFSGNNYTPTLHNMKA